jgi:hypothetical protein
MLSHKCLPVSEELGIADCCMSWGRLQKCMLCTWAFGTLPDYDPSALLTAVHRLAYRHACPSHLRAAARPQSTPDNRKGNRMRCASSSASLRDSDAQVCARRFSAAARPAAGAWTARRAGSRWRRSRSRRSRRRPTRPRAPAPPSPPSPAGPAHASNPCLGFLQALAPPPLPVPAGPAVPALEYSLAAAQACMVRCLARACPWEQPGSRMLLPGRPAHTRTCGPTVLCTVWLACERQLSARERCPS